MYNFIILLERANNYNLELKIAVRTEINQTLATILIRVRKNFVKSENLPDRQKVKIDNFSKKLGPVIRLDYRLKKIKRFMKGLNLKSLFTWILIFSIYLPRIRAENKPFNLF